MGRPRSFDEDEVLERALEVFWRQGYTATSIVDLEAATGLKAGSLYKAFRHKHALFVRAVDRYLEEGRQMAAQTFGDLGPREALARWLDVVAEMATATPACGCFAVNCAVELAPHDDRVREALRAHDRRLLRLFTDLVRRGQAAGELRAGDPTSCARHLLVFINGLQVEGKKGLSRPEAKRLVAHLLDTLSP
ncbi:MAG: TetR/AcrR family transcriptional regulator [Myxococcota bacterium]